MPLADTVIWLAGLCEIALPSRTVRLCDGAFVNWPARGLFESQDTTLGTIDALSPVGDSVGDEAPQGSLTLLPPAGAAAASLFQPNAQGGAMNFWLAEVSGATGAVVGTPDLLFAGRIDTIKLMVGRTRRQVEITFMSEAERLFWTREGNVLSDRWQQSIWTGEKGLEFTSGAQVTVPWGLNTPRGGSAGYSGGSGGGGSFGGNSMNVNLV